VTFQFLDQNGQPFTASPPGQYDWNVTENVVGPPGLPIQTGAADLSALGGVIMDTMSLSASQPTAVIYNQTITVWGPLAPMTGQEYSFTVGYLVGVTGPNQGYIAGTNGIGVNLTAPLSPPK
jgi:hypothetical protein